MLVFIIEKNIKTAILKQYHFDFIKGDGTTMIILNGKAVETPAGLTLAGLLKERQLPAAELIVELNGVILEKSAGFAAVELRDQDRLNLFRIVTGG